MALTPGPDGGGSVLVFRKQGGIAGSMSACAHGGAVIVSDANGLPSATLPSIPPAGGETDE